MGMMTAKHTWADEVKVIWIFIKMIRQMAFDPRAVSIGKLDLRNCKTNPMDAIFLEVKVYAIKL
jgi:hypothetical protein